MRVALPGVGRNLQDRYEVAVVNKTVKPWEPLQGATFTRHDRQYQDWSDRREGVYATNGVLLSVVARSSPGNSIPTCSATRCSATFEATCRATRHA